MANYDCLFNIQSNLCKLRADSCKQQRYIDVLHLGICDKCRFIQCQYYGSCVYNGKIAKCYCIESCQNVIILTKTFTKYFFGCFFNSIVFFEVSIPVCGSDGRIYQSVCHLQLESCSKQKLITVLHHGLHCGD